jgi:hypothetical protein
MSSLYDSSGKSIPLGILVKNAKQPERSERPNPRRKSEDGERQIPWLWIAAGGSVGWIVIVLVVAMLTRGQENLQQQEQPFAMPRAIDGPLAENAPIPKGRAIAAVDAPPDVAEVEPGPARGPRLAPKQIQPNEGPPPIDIPPEDIPLVLPAPAPGAVPGNGPIVIKPGRKDVDLKVFANCEQIGTDVLFVKDPPKAFLRAKDQKKMVFMVHLSGNLEDPGFT